MKKYWPVYLIFLLSFLITWPLFLPGYFSHQDSLQVMRIFEMRKCFEDLQIPCRWVPDMGRGFGYPLFNYYNPTPYIIGAPLSIIGYITSAKILFFIPLILGGLGMYLLGDELFGQLAGLVSAVLFLFAPYRALDSYVRGDVSESFSISLVPLLSYLIIKISKDKSNFIWLCLITAVFLTSHNLMVIIFLPFFIFWTIYWSHRSSNKWVLFFSLALGFGLSAFFILPALFEQNLVSVDSLTQGSLNFRINFVMLNQLLFDRLWGYGLSGEFSNPISLQIGWPLWWIALLSGIFVVASHTKKIIRREAVLVIFLFMIFLFSVFMTLAKSDFIWETFTFLKYIQFPWRFLAVSIFSGSLLGGFMISALGRKENKLVAIVVIVLAVGLNWNYFKPAFHQNVSDQDELSGELWEEAKGAALSDYLPTTATPPINDAPSSPIISGGMAQVERWSKTSNSFKLEIMVSENSDISIPIFYFPGWRVWANGNSLNANPDRLGRMSFSLHPGHYNIVGNLGNTPIRNVGNLITLLSLLGLVYGYRKVHQ